MLFRSSSRRVSGHDWRLRALVAGLVLFVAGGLWFGYIFVSTASELLALQSGAGKSGDLAQVPSSPTASPAVLAARPDGTPIGPAPQPTARPTIERTGRRVNVLLLGLDERPAEAGGPSRSDTMLVATIDTQDKTAALFSIPRDLWVAIPKDENADEVVYNKITAAHFFGQYWHYPDGKNADGGPALAKWTVEYNLGIPIDYYMRIDFKGFEKAIDLLGGIDVHVGKDILDTAYPLENDTGVTTIHFTVGQHHFDGKTALQYARTRNVDDDFGRQERQRQVLMAVFDKAMSLDVVTKLPQLLGLMRDSFDTDMPLDQMPRLANVAREINPDDISTRSIEYNMVLWNEPINGALLPKQAEIGKLIQEVFGETP
ncbi:MAG: LCP family protein [Dehalococcoidales bacterium]|nr:LCP family protein [Dehalococcoidales bacterium]